MGTRPPSGDGRGGLQTLVPWQRALVADNRTFARVGARPAPAGGCRLAHPAGAAAVAWGLLALVLTMSYVAILEPILVAFDTPLAPLDAPAAVIDFACGAFFAADVLASFSTGLYVVHRDAASVKLVMCPREVASLYVAHGSFVPDAVACVPFAVQLVIVCAPEVWRRGPLHQSANVVQLLRLLRLLRLTRLRRLLRAAGRGHTLFPLPPVASFALEWVFLFLFAANFVACLSIYVAHVEGVDRSWLTAVGGDDLSGAPPAAQWLAAFYWATATLTTVGYGDVSATTNAERAVASLCMGFGAVFFAYIVGGVAALIDRSSQAARRRTLLHDRMVDVEQWLSRREMPSSVRSEVRMYYQDVWLRRRAGADEETIFEELPDTTRAKAALHITEEALRRVFGGDDEGLVRLMASHLRPRVLDPGRHVASEGDPVDRVFFLTSGRVEAFSAARGIVGRLAAGTADSFFGGECAKGGGSGLQTHVCTFRTVTPVQLWELRESDLTSVATVRPEAARVLRDGAFAREVRKALLSPSGSSSARDLLAR